MSDLRIKPNIRKMLDNIKANESLTKYKPTVKPEKGIQWTKDQENAIEKIQNWLNCNTKGDNFFILEGVAGSGKTTLLKKLKSDYRNSIVATAPTHKACQVLGKAMDIKTVTIQKLLGLRPNFDVNNASDKLFEQTTEPTIKNYKWVIIDESSMIPNELEMLIKKEAMYYNTKVLYVGDPYQLKPINPNVLAKDNKSVFDKEYPKERKAKLEEIVRQELDNPLIELLTVIRKDIQFGTLNFLTLLARKGKIVNGKGYITLYNQEFSNEILKVFNHEEFSKDINFIKYLTYTNSNVAAWNDYIRKSLLHDDCLVNQNDLFLGYENIMDEFNTLQVINSQEYYVNSFSNKTTDNKITGFDINLTDTYTNKSNGNIFLVDHTNKDEFQYFVTIAKHLIDTAKTSWGEKRKTNWKNYFIFKNQHLLLKDILLSDDYKGDRITKSLDYGYAMSVHKS